ncbi:MAG: regulatory iron-sulfur-containing complex subunit RicT [Elusimicrobiota bacterium]
MPVIVDVAIRKKEEKVVCDTGDVPVSVGDRVILEIDQSQEMGVVVSRERMIEKPRKDACKILRRCTPEDIKRLADNRIKKEDACRVARQKIEDHEIKMKLTCVDYSFDRAKLYVYYTAETRIDFRQLIKDLGHMLKTRIQMVQIGSRDETRMLGGLGPCGRVLCCKNMLRDFIPVTIDMAKIQDPSLNVSKMSGPCGRLMCCIAYEDKFYSEQLKKMPRVGSRVRTPEGEAKVISVHLMKECITVEFPDKQVRKYNLNEIK